jgi:hypothetical protein
MFIFVQIETPLRRVVGKMSSRIMAKDHKIDCFNKGNSFETENIVSYFDFVKNNVSLE